MGKYDRLDELIIKHLTSISDGMHLIFLNGGAVADEAALLAKGSGRKAFRVLDGRLQALRMKGIINYDRKKGWRAI